jgi:hypothetical protein
MTAIAPAVRPATAAVPDQARSRPGVAWWTVLPLAALMAYGDGFWVMSLREAAGAIERMDSPFQAWLRESTLFLPVFVIAVLAATSVALARFGPSPRRTRAVLVTALLVVAAGTLAGVLGLAVSSAYDYHLQAIHMEAMNAMRDEACDAACAAAQHRTDLALQVRAVAVGGALMLLTNLVLVGWAVALRGGRMALGTVRASAPSRDGRVRDYRMVLITGLVGSAAIHAAVVPEHLQEWTAAGTFFVLLVLVELALALAVLLRPDRLVLVVTAWVSVATLLLWLVSRTVGLPFGPEAGVPEAVGLPDVACCLLELVTLAAAVIVLRRWSRLARQSVHSPHARAIAVLCLVAITTLGLGATEVSWLHAFGTPGEAMSHGE